MQDKNEKDEPMPLQLFGRSAWSLGVLYNKETGAYFVPWLADEHFPEKGIAAQTKKLVEIDRIKRAFNDYGGYLTAILDTGIMKDHPFLKPHIVEAVDFTGEGPEDQDGHGSNVAVFHMLSDPSEKILSIKVKGSKVPAADEPEIVANGIKYAVSRGARVISLAIGWPVPCKQVRGHELICEAIREAIEHLVLVFVVGEAQCPAECHKNICVMGQELEGKELSLVTPTFTHHHDGAPIPFMQFEEWQQAMQIERNNAALAYATQGEQELRAGKYKEAMDFFDDALALDPRLDRALDNKGIAFLALEDYDGAMRCFDHVLQLEPENYFAWANKGSVFAHLGKHDDAIRCLDVSLALKPDLVVVLFDKAMSLAQLDKCNECIECCDRALRLDPSNAYVWYLKGLMLEKLGQCDEAKRQYAQAIELDSEIAEKWKQKMWIA